MITLEQIRLLEGKIARAIELIRILKEENATLRKGLDSAQKRMKELETLVEGFKSDQKEIESVIVRTIKNLDELEESAGAATRDPSASSTGRKDHSGAGRAGSARPSGVSSEAPGGPTDDNPVQAAAPTGAAGERSQRNESPKSAADVSVETQTRPAADPGPATAPTGAAGQRSAVQGVGRMGSFAAPESGNSGREDKKGELDIF